MMKILLFLFIIAFIFTQGCKDCDLGTFNDQKHGVCRPWTEYVLFLFPYKTTWVNFLKDNEGHH